MRRGRRSLAGERLGLRREVVVLVPACLVLVLGLSLYTLLSYRNTLSLLVEERRGQTIRAAQAAAARLGEDRGEAELRRAAREALGAALVDPQGRGLVVVGDLPSEALLAPLGGLPPREAVALGPLGETPGRIVAFVPLGAGAGGAVLRLDLGAALLAGQIRFVRILTGVVVALDAGVLALLLLFLRHLLSPFERLLDRAREAGGGGRGEDEVDFLLATFEQALAALARERAKGAEDDLAALERTLAASLESGLLLLDRHGAILAVNPRGAELLGLASPPAGTPLAEALAASHPALASRVAAAVAAGLALQRAEVETGGRTLGLSVHPLRRDDGSARGYLVLFADLTEVHRRESEVRLSEGLAQLGEMAAGVAHELRNSLATLEGYLSLIERRPDEGSVVDFLGEIRHETAHLRRVVEDFLAFARPGTARLETVDLPTLLARAAADPALAGAAVGFASGAPAASLRGDPQLLERALKNLLRNAVEAEREAGLPGGAQLALRRAADGVEITIDDRGRGLPAEVRERLFQPFVSARPGGVGLGLALAHRIVALHGGTLRLGDRPGGGTRAAIVFPGADTSE